MAFDTILQEKMKVRHKQGFKPPKRGRKTDLEGDAQVSHAHDIMHMAQGVIDKHERDVQCSRDCNMALQTQHDAIC